MLDLLPTSFELDSYLAIIFCLMLILTIIFCCVMLKIALDLDWRLRSVELQPRKESKCTNESFLAKPKA